MTIAAIGMAICCSVAMVWSAPTPAYATPGCYGRSCDGLDPGAVGCTADAHLLQKFAGSYGEVKLYHSRVCGSAWATEKDTFASTQEILPSIVLLYVSPLGGREQWFWKEIKPAMVGMTLTTGMTDWRNSVKACDGLNLYDVDRFAVAEPTAADQDTESDGAGPQGICGEWF